MPWPAGEAERLRARRGDPLADRAGTVDRLIVAHGLETCDSPTRCSPRSGGCSRRAGGRSSSCRTAPASGRGATSRPSASAGPTASASSRRCCAGTASSPERHAAALYAPPSHRRFWLQTAPISGNASAAASSRVLVAGALLRRGLEAGLRPPAGRAARSRCPARSRCSKGLERGRKPRAGRAAHGRPARQRAARPALAGAGRLRRTCGSRRNARRGISVLPRSRRQPLLSPRRFRRAQGCLRARIDRCPPAGAPGSEQRKGGVSSSASIDLGGRRSLRRPRSSRSPGRARRSTRSRPMSRRSRPRSPTAPTCAS